MLDVVASPALFAGEQLAFHGLLDALGPGGEAMHDVSQKHLLCAGVGAGLVAVADHDWHDLEEAADFLDLMPAGFEVLGIDAGL